MLHTKFINNPFNDHHLRQQNVYRSIINESINQEKELQTKNKTIDRYKRLVVQTIYLAELDNNPYNPLGVDLTGWGKQVSSNINDYTQILEKNYDEYKVVQPKKMSLIMQLCIMLISSGVSVSHPVMGLNRLDE